MPPRVELMEIHPSRLSILLFVTILASLVLIVSAWKKLAIFLLSSDEISNGIVFSDKTSSGWFLAHPVLAITGTVCLPVPGVLVRKYKGYWSKKVHAFIFGAAILCITLSVYVIYTSKEAKNRPHVTSNHGLMGYGLMIAYVGMSIIGILTLDPDMSLISSISLKAWFKWVHATGGRNLIVIGFWICYSGWYKFFSGTDLLYGVVVAVIASLFTVLNVADQGAKSVRLLA